MSEFKISPKDWNIDGKLFKPSDKIILTGGTRGEIQFVGLRGTKDKPIIITATDKLLIKRAGQGGRVVHFFNCDYFIFTGGDKDLIEITGGGHGVTCHDMSNHMEISQLYIHHVGYSGIDITNYPTCDPKTWRGAYTMADVIVAQNRITDLTDGEAVYIGPSHYQSSFPLANCPNGAKSALEHDVINVQVIDNEIKNIGADGIQVGGATGGGVVKNNRVTNFGTKKVFGQSSGIQANPGSELLIEENTVDGGTNFGIISQGRTGTIVRRNKVNNTAGGIMAVARETNDKGTFQVYNNTFTDITGNGVESYSNTDFKNNVLQMKAGGSYYKKFGGDLKTDGNYTVTGSVDQLGLDASGIPTAASKIPLGVGWKDYVKPEPPKPVKLFSHAIIEQVTTNGVAEYFLTVEDPANFGGFRKKLE